MKLSPRSMARLSAWIDSSSSAPPHCAPPMPQAPYPISDTAPGASRSEEHTSELQSHSDLHSFPTRRSSDLAVERLDRLVVVSASPLRAADAPGAVSDLGQGAWDI